MSPHNQRRLRGFCLTMQIDFNEMNNLLLKSFLKKYNAKGKVKHIAPVQKDDPSKLVSKITNKVKNGKNRTNNSAC